MHKTKIYYLDKTFELITDNDMSMHRFNVFSLNGNYQIRIYPNKEKYIKPISFAKFLFGFPVAHKNGNRFDFRACNVEKFSMADYNLKHRKYKTNLESRGIRKVVDGYKVRIHKNSESFDLPKVYESLTDAIKARINYQKRMGII